MFLSNTFLLIMPQADTSKYITDGAVITTEEYEAYA